MWNRFATALCFLTILPCPFRSQHQPTAEDALAQSFATFPVVGLILGMCCLVLAHALRLWTPPLLLATLVTALMIILSRGLHLDGLADLADGVGGGYTTERRLAIMKDSRTGTFGSLALILAVVGKVAAYHTLLLSQYWTAILLIPALSRFAMVLTAYNSPYARPEGGLGKPFLQHMTASQVRIATITSALFALLLMPAYGMLYLVAAGACAASLRLLSRRWLGGVTGDVLGATNEITEITLLCLASILAIPH